MVEKRLGALPVAAEFLRRLDVAGIVDEVCPGGASAHLTHGQVIEALVVNRLTSPAPLVRVGDWARTWAVEEVFGIEPALLNDNRLARAPTGRRRRTAGCASTTRRTPTSRTTTPRPRSRRPCLAPGTAALAEHVLATGHGRWWTDRTDAPRVIAVSCAGHALLAGDPTAVAPRDLVPLAGHHIKAADRFLPVLGAAFEPFTPWERMLYLHRAPASSPPLPRGVSVRRLTPQNTPALAALDPAMAWIHGSWGGPAALAASGLGWAAFRRGRIAAVACTRFLGSRYEDLACATVPEERRQHLALACVAQLTEDVAARGRTASWSCSRDNRPSRLLAWSAGFRLAHEYVHYAAGRVNGATRLATAA
ncbi:GNAT family N-acetyltransferase [Streptomyces sp. NPDC059909]|uniref:GNAT family N-acetyltransferase n=1 Tax=Streptomyces sp. NPDC059909 TaxID=3346998 RepID=UPI0036636239